MKHLSRSELALAIQSSDWAKALKLIEQRPDLATRWSVLQGFFEGLKDAKVLPLHQACAVAGVSQALMERLVQIYPQAIHCRESSYQRLPLHCACRTAADPAIIRVLLQAEQQLGTCEVSSSSSLSLSSPQHHQQHQPQQCLQADLLQRVPLHYALSNGAHAETIQLLLQAAPQAAASVDRRGWTPLHVATSVGCSVAVLRMVLEAHPAAIDRRTLQGSSPAKCLHRTCRHRQELKKILRQAKKDYESSAARDGGGGGEDQQQQRRSVPSKTVSCVELDSSNSAVELLDSRPHPISNRSQSHDGFVDAKPRLVRGYSADDDRLINGYLDGSLPIDHTTLV